MTGVRSRGPYTLGPARSSRISVCHQNGQRFESQIRGHYGGGEQLVRSVVTTLSSVSVVITNEIRWQNLTQFAMELKDSDETKTLVQLFRLSGLP